MAGLYHYYCWKPRLGLTGLFTTYLTVMAGLCHAVRSLADDAPGNQPLRQLMAAEAEFHWLAADGDAKISLVDVILSRSRRDTSNATSGDKSVWDEIEEFYSDKNNMAMYCVLPILILIYGGCSGIYCIHKCRQYLRRRSHKRLKEEDCDSLNSDKNDLNQEEKRAGDTQRDRPISQISQAWVDMNMDTKGKWSGQTEAAPNGVTSPLPWLTGDNKDAAVAGLVQGQPHKMETKAGGVDDKLRNEDFNLEDGGRTPSQAAGKGKRPGSSAGIFLADSLVDGPNDKTFFIAGATVTSSSTDVLASQKKKHLPEDAHELNDFAAKDPLGHAAQQHEKPRPVPLVVRAADRRPFEETRVHANLEDYSSNKSTALKATDFSRFSEAKPIEIVPLSADPNLRAWDPLHNRPFGENSLKLTPLGAAGGSNGTSGRASAQAMKEELLARYDALSTLQMAKKAAEILKTNAVDKSPFQRKPTKKKHIFIAE
ncbi:unnamed protein product [Lymnaea stagnalis]|uniref:Uncharacterized protein n=1 Tax=Lymnaea stagnalis TaxID=6523 RepID=A0AAV2HB49_LYMST